MIGENRGQTTISAPMYIGGLTPIFLNGITLIDRKTALTTCDKQIQSVQRVSAALKQNPGVKAVFEFPNQKAADRATDILVEQNIRNISVRVAP